MCKLVTASQMGQLEEVKPRRLRSNAIVALAVITFALLAVAFCGQFGAVPLPNGVAIACFFSSYVCGVGLIATICLQRSPPVLATYKCLKGSPCEIDTSRISQKGWCVMEEGDEEYLVRHGGYELLKSKHLQVYKEEDYLLQNELPIE